MTSAYLDASALVKLVVAESESDALDAALRSVDHKFTSIVGRIELERVVRRQPDRLDESMAIVLDSLEIVPLHAANAALAAEVTPTSLRSLDAIHLATLLEISDDIDAFYCYDQQLAEAALAHGIMVVAPG